MRIEGKYPNDALEEREVDSPEWWLLMAALKIQVADWGT
jgi:hypothetical protein